MNTISTNSKENSKDYYSTPHMKQTDKGVINMY